MPDLSGNTNLETFFLENFTLDGWESTALPSSLTELVLYGGALYQSEVDDILAQLDTAGASNGQTDLRGNTAPSATGLAAKTSLEGKGWTVLVDT